MQVNSDRFTGSDSRARLPGAGEPQVLRATERPSSLRGSGGFDWRGSIEGGTTGRRPGHPDPREQALVAVALTHYLFISNKYINAMLA